MCRNMRVAPYKSLTEKCARKAPKETNNQSACTWNDRIYIKLKLILSQPGLSVPSSKINCIFRRFRLVLLPPHCLTLQTLMSYMAWLAEVKCSATGSPRDRFRMLRRCSLRRSRRRLPVSPMYMLVQRRQVMHYTTFSD